MLNVSQSKIISSANHVIKSVSKKTVPDIKIEPVKILPFDYGIADLKIKSVFDANKKLVSYSNTSDGICYLNEFERDKKGRLLRTVFKVNGKIESTTEYSYFIKGNEQFKKKTVKNKDGIITYKEIRNQSDKIVSRDFCGESDITGCIKEEIEYSDNLVKKRTRTDLNGKVTTYEYFYDKRNNLSKVVIKFEPDAVELFGNRSTVTHYDGMIREICYKDGLRTDVCKTLKGDVINTDFYNKNQVLVTRKFEKPDEKGRIKIEYDNDYTLMTETFSNGTQKYTKLGL